jgi:hypothetical protein
MFRCTHDCTKRKHHYLQRFWKGTNALNTKEMHLADDDYKEKTKCFFEINYLETATTQQSLGRRQSRPSGYRAVQRDYRDSAFQSLVFCFCVLSLPSSWEN